MASMSYEQQQQEILKKYGNDTFAIEMVYEDEEEDVCNNELCVAGEIAVDAGVEPKWMAGQDTPEQAAIYWYMKYNKLAMSPHGME